MKGVIDIGNTRIKTAVFSSGGTLEDKSVFDTLQEASDWHAAKGSTSVILATVRPEQALEAPYKLHRLGPESRLPFENLYKSPNTLGADRIAAMAAAAIQFPEQAVLVFDIGTCITIDVLHPGKRYLGGNISPGIEIRLQALHQMTGRLPLVSADAAHSFMGTDTRSAIAAGVISGIQNELEGYIRHFQIRYPDLLTVFCGGDQSRFDLSGKYKIFATPDFVLQGLYNLLILNED